MAANLILHHGAHGVDRSALLRVPTPEPTSTWQPIAHAELLSQVESALPRYGLAKVSEAHGLTHDGARYFGLLEVRGPQHNEEYIQVVGVRNSHDKRLPAGVAAGSQVVVCSNLMFTGEIKVFRKHTSNILRDLPMLIGRAIEQLLARWHDQDRWIARFKNCSLSDRDAHDLTIRALDRGVICGSQIPKVLSDWREPQYAAFQRRTLWSWFNSVTEHLKGNLPLLPRRTAALYGLCDAFVGEN